jgi:DMSO/TMAO reductase YedYZ molybdopterin-dependent catalytic subunit
MASDDQWGVRMSAPFGSPRAAGRATTSGRDGQRPASRVTHTVANDWRRGKPYASAPESPENRPAPLSVLLDDVTPTELHYRRNHFPYPAVDATTWALVVRGAVERPYELTLDDLNELPRRSVRVLLECAGHRRTEFSPPIGGVQWGMGAVSQADWSGVALRDVLDRAGVARDAVEVVLYGADHGPFPEVAGAHPFARSLPLAKAMDPATLLALEMNGQPLPYEHGAPLRAIVPGWYGMDSVKWLTAIEVSTDAFRGVFQELDYRFQSAGETGIGARLDVVAPHAVFVSVDDGVAVPGGRQWLTGVAWAGRGVASVEVRVGPTGWEKAEIIDGSDPYQRVVWRAEVDLTPGLPVIVAVRATDTAGVTQPPSPNWNRRGYANNSVQRLELLVV